MRLSIVSLLATTQLLGTGLCAYAQGNAFELPLNDPKLAPMDLALQRYKRKRLTVRIEGESWNVVQGINETIQDEQLLQLAGMSDRLKEQRRKEFLGGIITLAGAATGIFGVLALANVVPLGDELRLGVGFGTLGAGIAVAGVGEFLFPLVLPGEHFISIDEARSAALIINARLKEEVGLPAEFPEP